MKFAIIILVVIAVVSLLSMFLVEFYPMSAGFPGWEGFYQDRYGMGDGVFALFKYLQLYDPYRSWWYQGLLGLLGLSLFACLADRIPIAIRQTVSPQFRLRPDDLKILPQHYHVTGSIDQSNVIRSLKKRFRIFVRETETSTAIYGHRGRLNLFGPIGIHLGMLVLVLGGLWISMWGSATSINGYAGDIVDVPGADFQVRIDDFRIEYYPLNAGQIVLMDSGFLGRIKQKLSDSLFAVEHMVSSGIWVTDTMQSAHLTNQFDLERDRGNIKDYLCDVTIVANGQDVSQQTIEVNHPLRHQRYRFYQSSFDAEHPRFISSYDSLALQISQVSDQTIIDTLWLKPDQKMEVPQTLYHVAATQFFPDFRITEEGATSISTRMNNPAVKLELFKADSSEFHQWSFLKREFHQSRSDLPVSLQFVDIRNPISNRLIRTIIQVRRSPGTELIWVGFAIATLGLMLAFYTGYHRIWVLMQPRDDGNTDIHIAMTSRRGSSDWDRQFQTILHEITTST